MALTWQEQQRAYVIQAMEEEALPFTVREQEVYGIGAYGGLAGAEADVYTTAQPVPSPAQALEPGVETEDPVLNGISTSLPTLVDDPIYQPTLAIGNGVTATPAAFPLAVAGIVTMSLGVFRTLLARFGPKLAKLLVGVAAFKEFMDMLTGGNVSDDTRIPIKPGARRRKRYSIGANPRVGTLAKVARHTIKLLKRHDKVIREFLPKPRQLPAKALARTYLSPAEKKALRD